MTQDVSVIGRVPEWTLGERLRKAREDTSLSQTEWADRVGVSRRSVSNYESGVSTPSRPVMLAWAMAAGVRLDWLKGDDGPKGSPDSSGVTRRYLGVIRGVLPQSAASFVTPATAHGKHLKVA